METYDKVYWSRDARKKKKSFSDGVVHLTPNKVRLYGSQGQLIIQTGIKNVYYHNPDNEEEFIISNSIYVSIDYRITKELFISGKVFLPVIAPQKKKKIQKISQPSRSQAISLDEEYEIDGFLAKFLRPHQIEGVAFMFDCLMGKRGRTIAGCILADYMGLGKTLQTLTLLYTLLKIKKKTGYQEIKKSIVVCPLTLVNNWDAQCKKWLGDKLFPITALGNGNKFAKDQYRLLLVSYESFYTNISILSKSCDVIVFDEGHRLKNPKGKLFKQIYNFSCKRRVLLTGTPLQNSIEEFHACIKLVNPMLFPSDTQFNNLFKKPILDGMKKNSSENQRFLAFQRSKQLTERIKCFSLRRRADVLEKILPDKKQYHIFVKLTSTQRGLYDRILQGEFGLIKDPLLFIVKTRKLLIHPRLYGQCCYSKEKDETMGSYKIEFCLSVVRKTQASKEQIIISSYFTETLTLIQQLLEAQNIKSERLDGSMTADRRKCAVDKFKNNSTITVFLLSAKAGGVGLNLTCANKIVMMEPDWNPSSDQQVMGRIWRDGQAKPVHIYRLIAESTFEEKILQRQYMKQSLSEKLIDESKSNKLFDQASLKDLIIKSEGKCITYKEQDNQLREVRRWNEDFSNSEDLISFVYIRKPKNSVNGVNEFQDEELFLQEQNSQNQQESEGIEDPIDQSEDQSGIEPLQPKVIKIKKTKVVNKEAVVEKTDDEQLDIVVKNGKGQIKEPKVRLLDKLLKKANQNSLQ